MIGYKATDKDGNCRGFHYEVGKTYTKDTKKENMKCCTNTVFHFCRELFAIEKESDYKLSESRIFEVIAGDFVRSGDKYGTNVLTIIREITGEEKKDLLNSGNRNSGNWNSGYFNSNEGKIRMFNKEINLSSNEIKFPIWCYFNPNIWVSYDTATEEEKKEHKLEIEICGGFLKTLEYKQAWKIAYNKTNDEEKKQLFKLPNYDCYVFEEISGIDTRKDYERLSRS